MELNNFELITRFSDGISERWDHEFIKRSLDIQQKEKIKKIWVCGPPLMNETFDKTLMSIKSNYNFDENSIEVL